MARELTLKIKRKEYTVQPIKIDRKKLYGYTEILALDDNGEPCALVSTDETGQFIIDKGGTGLAILTPSGEWAKRSQLELINEDGTKPHLIPSSYNIVNQLKEKVTIEEYLDYNITDFYELADAGGELVKAIGEDIYKFTYSYLDNYEGNTAFVLVAGGTPFMLIGILTKFEMLCFGDCGTMDEEEDFSLDLDDNNLDFSMF